MENFNDFMADDIKVVDEDALSEAMWDFVAGLSDDTLDGLDAEQLGEYVEIVEAVASDEEPLEEKDKLSVPQKHQLAIAKKTLKMSDAGATVMGGMNKKEAVDFLKSIGYSDARIKKMSESVDDIDEAMPAKKVRRDMMQKRAASREHRKVKAKRKLEGKRKRKTAEFRRFKKKSKRLGKRGLTSTGKRKRTYINKG
jgi:hypothetical protein